MQWKRLSMLAGILALSGCKTAAPVKPLPPYFDVANAEHPKYPHSRFITGTGSSDLSQADADAHAKANVSSQILSRIKSELSSYQEFASKTGGTNENVKVVVQEQTEFARADLIHIVEHAQQGEMFHSFAALDRAAADRELADASIPDLTRFQASVTTASRARRDHDAGVAAAAMADAKSVRGNLDTTFVVRRAVAGHRAAEQEEQYAQYLKQLVIMDSQIKAHQVVGVVFSKDNGNHLGDLAINAVKHIGLRTDSKSCKDRDADSRTDATELTIEPEEKCSEGNLGEKCEVMVHLVAQACGGSTSGAGTVPQVRGIHPSDQEKARHSAWEKITPKAVETAVREALASSIGAAP